jgi:hypothetical protein
MPFVSEKQRRLCWFLYNRSLNKGVTPKWDCYEWEKETPKDVELPTKKTSRNKKKKYKISYL